MFRLGIPLLALLAFVSVSLAFDSSLDGLWTAYKNRYMKQYTSATEELHRRDVFEQNVALIQKHNLMADLGLHSYRLGLGPFTDLTGEEYRNTMIGGVRSSVTNQMTEDIYPGIYDVTKLPPSVDWRKKGYVTPVFNQGHCGSSWATPSVGALEGQHKAATGKLVALSVQNILECVEKDGCYAGGYIDSGYTYTIKHGIDTDACYPYKPRANVCKFNNSCIGATAKSFVKLPTGSEKALQVATAKVGPIAAAVDASGMQHYKSGVFDDPHCKPKKEILHGVVVVGYGSLDLSKYWLVKNSWGTDWGEKGYILMSRYKNNQCGIANMNSYPTGVGF